MAREEKEHVEQVSPRKLEVSPFHKRTRWGDMRALGRSLLETGMIEPIIARYVEVKGRKTPKMEIVVGHRRDRAALEVDLDTVPVIFRELTDDEVIEIQATENMRREDLHCLDECDYFVLLMERGHDVRTLSKRFTRSPGYIKDRLALASLCSTARQAYAKDKISDLAARRVARLPTKSQQIALVEALSSGIISDDEIIPWIRQHALVPLTDVEWPLNADNWPGGACSECPKRTGAQREMFEDIVGTEDMCMDPKCWRTKMDAAMNAAIEDAKRKDLTIETGDPARVFLPVIGNRPVVVRSSGYVDTEAECPTVPGKRWIDAVIAATGQAPKMTLRADQDGRPRWLLTEQTAAAAVRKAVRDESSEVAAAEAQADPARRQARDAKAARVRAEDSIITALFDPNVKPTDSAELGAGRSEMLAVHALRLLAVRVLTPAPARRVARVAKIDPEAIMLAQTTDPLVVLTALLVAEVGVDDDPAIEIRELAAWLGVPLSVDTDDQHLERRD